jgi:hypothetical protein
MTIWSDYKPLPADNIAAPPVGAPEGMWPSATNDVLREIMSVINQLGQQVTDTFAGLGTMSNQASNNVNITGGVISGVTISGNGAGLTSLNAAALATGIVPAARLSGTYDITVTQANNANTVQGFSPAMLVPVGSITAWWGDPTALPANWRVCDGTNGTPDLRDRYLRGVGPGTVFGANVGAYTGSTDAQGSHSHGGATGLHTLVEGEIPAHTHTTSLGWGYMNNTGPANMPAGTATGTINTFVTGPTGGNQPHNHTLVGDGNHTHNVTTNPPPSVGVYWIMRMY